MTRHLARLAAAVGLLASASLPATAACEYAPVAEITPPSCPVKLGIGADLGGALPFPADNPWNQDISAEPVDPNSAGILARIRDWYSHGAGLGPEYKAAPYHGAEVGIPYVVVGGTQPLVPIIYGDYAQFSDPGPWPIPGDAPIEGWGSQDDYTDQHLLVVKRDCSKPNGLGKVFELFRAFPNGTYPGCVSSWNAQSGATWNLNNNILRPDGWTSADAAGLPIFPGLVRYDEVARALAGDGVIHHALRFTLPQTRDAHVYPARHHTHQGNTNPLDPPLGMRLRLRASWDDSGLPPDARVISRTLKRYGMLLADNGGTWFVTGAPDSRWNDATMLWISYIRPDQDMDVVKMGAIDFTDGG